MIVTAKNPTMQDEIDHLETMERLRWSQIRLWKKQSKSIAPNTTVNTANQKTIDEVKPLHAEETRESPAARPVSSKTWKYETKGSRSTVVDTIAESKNEMKDLQHCNTSDDAKNINSRPLPSPVEETQNTRNSPVARPTTASKTSKYKKKGSPLPVDAIAKSKNEMKELQKCSSCGLKCTKVYLRPLPLYYSTRELCWSSGCCRCWACCQPF